MHAVRRWHVSVVCSEDALGLVDDRAAQLCAGDLQGNAASEGGAFPTWSIWRVWMGGLATNETWAKRGVQEETPARSVHQIVREQTMYP